MQTTHSLPAERDAFVGREGELERIVEHLESNRDADVAGRLLTLLGVGGTGKTRLAQRYGWRSLARWPGGTWFCDLSDVHALDGVLSSVAASLGVSLGKDDPVVQLGHAIAGRGRALVILDNAEHVADHASAVLAAWLRRCREASFLVTSRERLRLDGEAVLALKPLDPVTDGVELFALRARASRPGFQLDPSSRAAVVEIVEKLDGLPLAIELAAARLRMLSLEQIRDRLADRFQLLAGGTRGRHATLDATLEWSWQLLLPWEQSAVAQATVFEGGFTLEAAEAVIDLSPFPEAPLVLDAMQSLVDKSWLQTRITREIPRFEMLATVRAFGSKAPRSGREPENAAARGFAARDLEERHARYFAAMGGDDALAALDGSRSVERRAELGLELENLIAACRRATELAIGEVAGPAYLAAGEMLALRGPIGSSLALGRRVLEVLRDPALRSRVARLLAEAEAIAGEPAAATEHVDQSLAAAREAHDRRFEGVVLGSLGNLLREQGQMERARAAFEAALAIHRETGHRRLEGVVLSTLGILLRELGQMEIARRHCEEALPIHREIGDRRSEGATLGALGTLHMEQGRMREAGTCFEQALAIHREVGNRLAEGTLLGNMGIFDREEGRMEAARGHFERALAIHRQAGHRRAEGVTLGNLASLDHDLGRLEDARAQFEEALAIHREVGNRRSEGIVLGNLGNLYSELGRETDARACYEQALVIAREVGNRRFEGNVLANLGDLHQEQGR
ncbi:MAG TPA: tetratricopeptide repeat protein, partial [Candidatus Udaeobacter sp.]|nr:tetratricopeptide repeat protein [Candidatus Udaeobacter sp.]